MHNTGGGGVIKQGHLLDRGHYSIRQGAFLRQGHLLDRASHTNFNAWGRLRDSGW